MLLQHRPSQCASPCLRFHAERLDETVDRSLDRLSSKNKGYVLLEWMPLVIATEAVPDACLCCHVILYSHTITAGQVSKFMEVYVGNSMLKSSGCWLFSCFLD